jgi:exoribonuclease R
MLSVRVLRAPAKQRAPQRERPRGGRRSGASVEQAGGREWWELNEEGTILRGERTGASVRLGDAVKVRVTSVDTPRGRVDLAPAG